MFCVDEGVGMYTRHNLYHTGHTGIYKQDNWEPMIFVYIRLSRALLDAGCLALGCRMLRAWMPDYGHWMDCDAAYGWMLDAVLVDAGCLSSKHRGCRKKIVDAG